MPLGELQEDMRLCEGLSMSPMSALKLRIGLISRVNLRSLATIAAILPMLATGTAHAHARLDHAAPGVGKTVANPPQEVTLWFTEKLESAFSTVAVTNDAGERVDNGRARISGNQMSVPLRVGGAGTYHVKWHVISVDTHPSDGSFTFRVGQ